MANITLIGISGAGKSTVGRILAETMGFEFIDVDREIEAMRGKILQDILDELGDEKFLELEEGTILNLSLSQASIISPGGSVVYSDPAMRHLKSISTIVHLKAHFDIIEKRISESCHMRGIVGLKQKSLKELYDEREHLYRTYADISVEVSEEGDRLDVVKEIIAKTKTLSFSNLH